MKKIILVIMLVLSCMVVVNAETTVNVKVNEEIVEFDVSPYIDENNRTLVPVRFISEKLGAVVQWVEDTREVVVTKADKVITLKIDDDKVKVNDEVITLDTVASIKDGRTFVPLRFVSEALGTKVEWDGETRTVVITDSGQATTEDEYGMTDEEFEEFINSDEGAKVASTDFFTIEDGKIIYHSQGLYTGYKNEEVNNSHFAEINDLAYDLIKNLSLYAKENGGAVSVRYSDLLPYCIDIGYEPTIEDANNPRLPKSKSFQISLYEKPVNEDFTHISIEFNRFWDMETYNDKGLEYIEKEGYKLDKYVNAYKGAIEVLYKNKDVSSKIFNYTMNEYDETMREEYDPNTSVHTYKNITLKNFNNDGYTLLFTTNY